MILNIDGHEVEGVLVVPQKEVNEFHVEARGNLDLLTFTTCHREETAESAWNVSERRGWLFKRKIDKKREVKISYKATEIEKSGGCPVFIGGYEKKEGRHSWAFVDFETDEAKLPAKIFCNGSEYNAGGVSACQSKMGLIQAIKFAEDVSVMPDADCSIGLTSGNYFEFPIKKGQCVYAFISASGKIHRLTTIGYEKILIRE